MNSKIFDLTTMPEASSFVYPPPSFVGEVMYIRHNFGDVRVYRAITQSEWVYSGLMCPVAFEDIRHKLIPKHSVVKAKSLRYSKLPEDRLELTIGVFVVCLKSEDGRRV